MLRSSTVTFSWDTQPRPSANTGGSSQAGKVTQRTFPICAILILLEHVQNPPKERQGEEEPNTPRGCGREKRFPQRAPSAFPGGSLLAGHKGEQPSSRFHLSAPSSPAAGRQMHRGERREADARAGAPWERPETHRRGRPAGTASCPPRGSSGFI